MLTSVHYNFLLEGVMWTVILTAIAFSLGGLGGFGLMLLRTSSVAIVRKITAFFIHTVQGIPVLILLFVAFYGLSFAGVEVHPLVAASIGLMAFVSVYLAEIWRGSLESIDKTQWEAGECLSLTRWQTLRLVVIPQAIRLSLPSTVGFLVQVLKATSLASVIGFVELTRAAQIINGTLFQPFQIYSLIAVFYFMLCYPLSLLSRKLESNPKVNYD